jgi:hypothetical protein
MRQTVLRIRSYQTILIRHAAIALIVCGFTILLYVAVELGHVLPSVEPRRELALSQIACFCGVRVMTVTDGGLDSHRDTAIFASPALEADLEAHLTLLETELAVYEASTLEKIGVRHVVLCGRLLLKGHEIGGVALSDRGTVFLNVAAVRAERRYTRGAIHHEIFHLIDLNDGFGDSDPRWEALNPIGFRYGKGGLYHLDDGSSLFPDDSSAGFLNSYSRSGAVEDKAEVFEYMMVCPQILTERMSSDEILSAKYRELRSRLKKSLPEMDDVFSARMRKRRVGPPVRGTLFLAGVNRLQPHANDMGMAGQIGRDDFALDLARAEQRRDFRICGHSPGQDQLRPTGILQDGGGLPGRRAEIVELIVERGGQRRASMNANPKAERTNGRL